MRDSKSRNNAFALFIHTLFDDKLINVSYNLLMKKILTVLFLLTFLTLNSFATPAEQIEEYTLENGMKVFLLEDSSDALVHVNFCVKAGFSSQTKNNTGFFKLYARVMEKSIPQIDFDSVLCNSDSTVYSLTTSQNQLSRNITDLSQKIFALTCSDELINAELNKLKNEVTDASNNMSYLINSAIDSKVFSDAPWKNDSGIYPPVFKKNTAKTARTMLDEIGKRWYIPQNSAIFIWGNINSEKTLSLIKATFGTYYSSYSIPIEKPLLPLNQNHKFVIHNPEFSKDMTQVVVQYTMLDMEECDILAAALNNNNSSFKKSALEIEELNIPGDEYINVSSAHKRNCSRLIIQTLLQIPENKKIKTTSVKQTNSFIEQILSIPEKTSDLEILSGKNLINFEMNKITNNPGELCQYLTDFWAYEPYFQSDENLENDSFEKSTTTRLMLSRYNKIQKKNNQQLLNSFKAEQPFIFVIINTEDYKKNKKEYSANGYIEINSKNSSWYVQQLYKNQKEVFQDDIVIQDFSDSSDNGYYLTNVNQITTREIESNHIKVTTKNNPLTSDISILLSIKGGKLNSADNHGFEEIMISLLGTVIQHHIEKDLQKGMILELPEISTQTNLYTSSILITCNKADFKAVCNAITQSLIYDEIMPAQADRAVSSRQYKKRLENGSAINQMYSGIIRTFYGTTGDFVNIFETKKDILQKTTYSSILEAYPDFLDAGRYSIIVTGNLNEDTFETIEKNFDQLVVNNVKLNAPQKEISFPKNSVVPIKIVHTFLTDIPKEKAGPQPAVLIPTTEFLDPVIYAVHSPEQNTKESALFNGMLNYLEKALQEELDSVGRLEKTKVRIQLPPSKMNCGCVIIENVSHTKEVDAAYKRTIQKIQKNLGKISSSKEVCEKIKNYWILTQMAETTSTAGTALLLQKGYEYESKPQLYLEEYNYIQNASAEDFMEILKYFPQNPELRLYSTDAKN
ncbi:MAG: insulinase family protein [Treponema sp.]|nr:insulinase family protein [Treponema sp.]